MNTIRCRWLRGLILLLAAALLDSCATSPRIVDTRPRFHETAAAEVVLRHYRWEHINLTKPDHREAGYLVQLSRETLGPTFEQLRVGRNLAVVVLGWCYSDAELAQLVAEWKNVLFDQGFKRVVCLRATGRGNDVDGALIIDDSRQTDAAFKTAARQ